MADGDENEIHLAHILLKCGHYEGEYFSVFILGEVLIVVTEVPADSNVDTSTMTRPPLLRLRWSGPVTRCLALP